MEKSPAQVIEEKGAQVIADALGIKGSAVRMWKKRDIIPRKLWPEIADAFPDLDTETLRQIEANRGRAA